MLIDLRSAKKVINSEKEKEVISHVKKKEDFESSKILSQNAKKTIAWIAPEYEVYEKSSRWYILTGSFLAAVVIYALYSNSPIMAITFILIGVVGFIYSQRDPDELEFVINSQGVKAGGQLYAHEDIKSFWIFYEPPHTKIISLHVNASIMPYIHIPIAGEDPVKIRELLLEFVPEVEQHKGIIDSLERFLHI